MLGFQFKSCTVVTALVLDPPVESNFTIESLAMAVSI